VRLLDAIFPQLSNFGGKEMSQEWKLHDLVVVKKQPKMQPFVKIEGLIAVITEIEGDYATITELQLSGQAEGGSGAVELDCLEIPTKLSAPMRAAYLVYKQNILRYEEKNQWDVVELPSPATIKRRRRSLKVVAQNNNIEPKVLHKILKDLDAAGVVNYL